MIFTPSGKALQAAPGKARGVAVAAIKCFLAVLLLLLLLESKALAEGSSVEILYNILFQEGFGGKQVIDGTGDQHLELYEPMIFINTQLTETTNLHLEAVYDSFSSASSRIFDARSGASAQHLDSITAASRTPTPVPTPVGTPLPGATPTPTPVPGPGAPSPSGTGPTPLPTPLRTVWESRRSLDAALSQKIGTWILSPSAGYSTEADYLSTHGGLNVQKSFAEDNFTVSLGGFYYQDAADVYSLRYGKFLGWTPKLTRSFLATLSQLLGPQDLILAGASYTLQTGYLAGSLNTVLVPQGRTQEVLPDARRKWTGTLRYVHGLSPLLALHADYRYYADNWGITSDTFEPSLVIGSEEETDLFQVAYRVYNQVGTQYYGESFPDENGYMTSDSDLQTFMAREIRVHFSHRWELSAVLEHIAFNSTLLYYYRNNDLRAWIFQAGLSGAF
jgi:hypothetical protein